MIRCDYCDKEMQQLDIFIFKCFTCNVIKKKKYNSYDLTYLIPKNSNLIFNMNYINHPYDYMINNNGNLPQYVAVIYNKLFYLQELCWDAKIFESTVCDSFDSRIITPQNIDQKIKTILTLE